MKKILILLILLTFCISAFAQTKSDSVTEKPWQLKINSVTVNAQRALRSIGVQQTPLDTLALRDNVTVSLADALTQNTTIFIKSYGRATLATASFRGTSPSHTQVTWNGMKLNSPMLGMVDFSMIPSYFIDDANVYHGASSVSVTGGGLGGAIAVGTKADTAQGFGVRYIQGVSSFKTYDEFLHLTFGKNNFKTSTRVAYSTSDNDFKYTNKNKEGHPTERNKNGNYKDFHALQEFYLRAHDGSNFGLSAWYLNSQRGVPMLNVDYREDSKTKNEQREQTLRAVASWNKYFETLKLAAKLGYTYTDLRYKYLNDNGSGTLNTLVHSQSYVNTAFAKFDAEYYLGKKWMFAANISAQNNNVKSGDRLNLVGYDKSRLEISVFATAKFRPTERLGFAVDLRDDVYGNNHTPLIPAAFADYLISKQGNVIAKISVAKNYRYPTLNDLYFLPGGNDSLRTEHGYTYDGSIEFTLKKRAWTFRGEATAFNSNISDWIVWLPTFRGFWSPKNVKRVHSYGIELKGKLTADFNKDWHLRADGNFAWTRSINRGEPTNWADESIGKQLVYVPEYSAAATAQIAYRTWTFTYKWTYYSKRYTTSSNETASRYGSVGAYFMNDISVEKKLAFSWTQISLKAAVNNIFNREYETVLSRPMARRNYGIFVGIKPKIGKK